MVIENLTQTALNKGVGPSTPTGTDRLLGETPTGQPKSFNVDSTVALVNVSSANDVSYDIRQFGAAGDGVTDDTAAFEAAVGSGSLVFISPGVYLVDRIDLPITGASLQGSSMFRTIVRGRSPGQDVFRWRHNIDVGDWETDDGSSFHFEGFRIEINVGDTNFVQESFDRCSADGFAVGPAGIAFERENFSDGNIDPGIGFAHLPAGISVSDMSFGIVGTALVHRASPIHFQGAAPGASIKNVELIGPDATFTVGMPFVRRVSNNPTTDEFTVLNGANPFKDGHRVLIRSHEASGTQPNGIAKTTVATVTNAGPSTFQLAGVSTTTVGGDIYAMAVESGASDYINPDMMVGPIWHYQALYGINIANAVGLTLFGPRIYKAKTALCIDDVPSAATSGSEALYIANGHFPGPDQALGSDPFIFIDCEGVTIDGWLYTGAGAGQPKVVLRGGDYDIAAQTGKAGASTDPADLPSLDIDADNVLIHGSHPSFSVPTIADPTEVRGRLRRKELTTNYLNDLSNWG